MSLFNKVVYGILLLSVVIISSSIIPCAGNFYRDFDITWGDQRAKILSGGKDPTLSLDKYPGSGFQSKNEYLFGRIDMQIQLVPRLALALHFTYLHN